MESLFTREPAVLLGVDLADETLLVAALPVDVFAPDEGEAPALLGCSLFPTLLVHGRTVKVDIGAGFSAGNKEEYPFSTSYIACILCLRN